MSHFHTEEERQAIVPPCQPAPRCRLLLGRGGQPWWKKAPSKGTSWGDPAVVPKPTTLLAARFWALRHHPLQVEGRP